MGNEYSYVDLAQLMPSWIKPVLVDGLLLRVNRRSQEFGYL